jgi:hypothetical protein
MRLPGEQSEKKSRWQVQAEALTRVQSELAKLAANNAVKAYAYDHRLKPLTITGGKLNLPAAPEGLQTDIGSTLAEALQAEQGKHLEGVLLLGDGAQTAYVELPSVARGC